MIGENLSERQVVVLQAVADACIGYQFASFASVKRIIQAEVDMDEDELDKILGELECECLVDNREIRGKPHVGLTEDGERCNRIIVL